MSFTHKNANESFTVLYTYFACYIKKTDASVGTETYTIGLNAVQFETRQIKGDYRKIYSWISSAITKPLCTLHIMPPLPPSNFLLVIQSSLYLMMAWTPFQCENH